ncbi:MAG: YceI family protein [Bacteroidetes bacterium]|nr:YceI family protein [Bacteroidota bacterium]
MKLLLILITFLFSTNKLERAILVTDGVNTITVKGTSTMHDWAMTSTDIKAESEILINGNDVQIMNFSGILDANSLKSGHKTMDKNAYKTLKTNDFPTISFDFKRLESKDPETATVKAIFSVTIAGVTKELSVNALVNPIGEDGVTINGTHNLKMSDFGIKPPSFMLGALKVGDDLVVEFTLNLKVSQREIAG